MNSKLIILCCCLVLVGTNIDAQNKSKPNLIVIMADDLGYADVGFNGSKDIPTPNIDQIAKWCKIYKWLYFLFCMWTK